MGKRLEVGRLWILPPGAVVPNPKSETRNPKQIQMPNGPRPRTASRVVVWVIPCLVLGVCFGLRGSDFGFPHSGWRQFQDAPASGRLWMPGYSLRRVGFRVFFSPLLFPSAAFMGRVVQCSLAA